MGCNSTIIYVAASLAIVSIICGFKLPGFYNRFRSLNGISVQSATSASCNELRSKTQFYNSLTKRKELFKPLKDETVSFYSCGPTVYDYAHIGNFRAFLTYDIIKRWLLYLGYDVHHVCNLTDVDDKILVKMAKEGASLQQITTRYTNAFFADLKVLNIIPANHYPKATEYIPQIENMISTLIDKNHAYATNGSVYYRIKSFDPKFGVLASFLDEENIAGSGGQGPNQRRGDDDKEDYRDFALWKAYNPVSDKDVVWKTELGPGRPGWHIECSAMCHSLLGESIDIHAGGSDLMFPHHSNEILQTEAFTGKQFSRFWMHNGFVNINNEKMSKSLKNFKTLRDIVQKPLDARAFRFLVLSVQYRNPINFNEEAVTSARNSLKRIDKLIAKLIEHASDLPNESSILEDDKVLQQASDNVIQEFEAGMSDDLNTPKAFAALFKLVQISEKAIKEMKITSSSARILLEGLMRMDRVLGLHYDVPDVYATKGPASISPMGTIIQSGNGNCDCGSPIHGTAQQLKSVADDAVIAKVRELAQKRSDLKKQKQFQEADAMRQEITALGFGVKDSKEGFEIYQLDG